MKLRRLVLALLVVVSIPVLARWEQVSIEVPVEPEIEVAEGEATLVALFRSNDHPRFSPGLEISLWLRRELERRTDLSILDVDPPPIPEQRPELLAVNDVFWKQLGEDFDASLIVAGVARFATEDRSGFVMRDLRDPYTGQMVRRSVFQDQTLYDLEIEVFFIKGENGALLHQDSWTAERILSDDTPQEDLDMLHRLLETMATQALAVVEPTTVVEPRFVWID